MSLQSLIFAIEADAVKLWGEAEGEVEAGAKELWSLAVPLFGAVEASVVSDLKAAIADVLKNPANAGADLATLEAAVLNVLEHAASDLLPAAKSIGSNLLQVLIGLVLHAL